MELLQFGALAPKVLFTRPNHPAVVVDSAVNVQVIKSSNYNIHQVIPDMFSLCRQGDLKSFKKYYNHAYLEKNDLDDFKTPLILVCLSNNYNFVKHLLDRGANANNVDGGGRTALHWSSYFGFSRIVKLLLSYNAYPSIRDNEGNEKNNERSNSTSFGYREF